MDRLAFEPYQKIPENSRAWMKGPEAARAITRVAWVATEKIHGANFCLIQNREGLSCAKRKAILRAGEDFFHHKSLLPELAPKAAAMFAALAAERPALAELRIFGELFGGGYPHDAVPAIPGLSPIQTGVYYCPEVRFCVFDAVAVEGSRTAYLGFDDTLRLSREAGLMVAEPLFIGGFEKAMGLPVRFTTTLPGLFGLPPLTEKNVAEGLVIKPLEALVLGGSDGKKMRPVIKRKIPEFAEDARYAAAQKPRVRFSGMREHALSILEAAMLPLINKNRLDAARSKIGALNGAESRAQLKATLVDDVLESLAEDYRVALEALPRDEEKLLRSVLEDEIQALMARELSTERPAPASID